MEKHANWTIFQNTKVYEYSIAAFPHIQAFTTKASEQLHSKKKCWQVITSPYSWKQYYRNINHSLYISIMYCKISVVSAKYITLNITSSQLTWNFLIA